MKDEKSILDEEHEELIGMLVEVAGKHTEVGRLFSEVLRIFRYHLDKENETVLPLLSYLKERLGNHNGNNKEALKLAWIEFKNDYPEMMHEHQEMGKLLERASNFMRINSDKAAMDLAEHLLNHVDFEEEILYPAAFASGKLIELEMKIS